MGMATYIFIGPVVDGLTACEFRANNAVLARVISHQERLAVNLGHNYRAQGFGVHVRNMVRTDLAATLN